MKLLLPGPGAPDNTPKIYLNNAADAFCIVVTNPNSTRAIAAGTAGYVWKSNAGGLQTTDVDCTGFATTMTDLVATP